MRRALKQLLLCGLISVICVGCTETKQSVEHTSPYPTFGTKWSFATTGSGVQGVFDNLVLTDELDPQHDGSSDVYTRQKLAFSLDTGQMAWSTPYPQSKTYADFRLVTDQLPLWVNGHFVLPTHNGSTYSLEVLDISGTLIKNVPLSIAAPGGLLSFQTMQLADDLVLVPTPGSVIAYKAAQVTDPANTAVQPVWSKTFTSDPYAYVVGSVAYDPENRIVYVPAGLDDGQQQTVTLHAYGVAGNELWNRVVLTQPSSANLPFFTFAAADRGRVIVSPAGKNLQAFDASGHPLWNVPNDCAGTSGMLDNLTIQDGLVFPMLGGGSCVDAYQLDSGKKQWQFVPPDHTYSFGGKVTTVNGVVYASNGYLWALDETTGALIGRSEDFMGRETDGAFAPYLGGGTVAYDEPRNQLLVWGYKLFAFQPVR